MRISVRRLDAPSLNRYVNSRNRDVSIRGALIIKANEFRERGSLPMTAARRETSV